MFEWLLSNGWALWLAVFLILAVVEMLTLDLFFIMMGCGALVTLVSALLGAPLWLQVIIFCLVSLLMIFLVRPIALKHLRRGPQDQLTNVDRLVGHQATVMEAASGSSGLVKIGGDIWTARTRGGEVFDVGQQVTVQAIDGATAIITAPAPLPTIPPNPAGEFPTGQFPSGQVPSSRFPSG